jgi:ATP-dependent exoDNAse (exonuclease V) beta subunit
LDAVMSSSDSLYRQDERARREALDTTRSLLLQAPAGSGKTTVLTARFLALLATVEAPEQILAITFTRKAAAEMRHRILQALETAARGGSIRGIEPGLLQAVAGQDRSRGWQLLRNAARLRIETIDALSYRLASSLPVAARSGAQLRITPTPMPLYRHAARSALRAALQEEGAADAVRLLLDRLDNRWARLEWLLADMLGRRSHWLPRVLEARADGLEQRVAASLDSVLRAQLARIAALLPAAALAEARQLLAHIGPMDRTALNADPASLPQWRRLSDLVTTQKATWRRAFSIEQGLQRQDTDLKQRVRDWIETLHDDRAALAALYSVRFLPDAALSHAEREAIEALATLLTRAAAELQLLFAQRGKVDYAYVAAAARQALSEQGEPSELALRASEGLRHILLDEFQDTSFDQFELLRSLTIGWQRGDGRTLFIVGDPMQSIYQFREAEVGLFLRARDHGLGGIGLEMLQLRRNFRSSAALIEWFNTYFARLFPAEDDARLAAVRYLPSVAAQPQAPVSGPAVQLHRCEPGDRVREAARVLQIVRRERARNPGCSISVLVAAREHAALVVAQLRAAGFALRGIDLEPLRDRLAVRDLSALTRVLLHAADRTAWLSLLRAPWCGLELPQLERFTQEAGADLFATLRGRAQAGSTEDCARVARLCAGLEPALIGRERGWPLWQRVERCWLRLAGPSLYPEASDRLDVHRFIDALVLHEEPDALVGEGMIALTDRLYSVAPPSPDAIEVMTIHAAKGLEWDVVIVPGLDSSGAVDRDPLLHWIELPRASEGTDLLLAPIRATDDEPEGLLAGYIKKLRRTRLELERVRQLYVAATRAQHSLHLLGAFANSEEDDKEPAPKAGSLLAALWPAVASEFLALESPAAPALSSGVAESPTVAPKALLRRLPRGWALPAPPLEPRAQRISVGAQVPEVRPEYSWVGMTARAIGTVVHAELRRFASNPEPRALRYREWLEELGVPADEQVAAEAVVNRALERTLTDPRGRWLLSGRHRFAESEWRLSGLHAGRIVNVVFDRMLIDEAGDRWIVDYKLGSHEGADIEQFIEREAERYAPQLHRYAALAAGLGPERIRVALYFPLLGVFRELPR